MVETLVINIIKIGLIGSLIFLAIITFVGLSGIANATRDKEGNFRKKINAKSLFGFGLFISFVILLLHLGNKNLIDQLQYVPNFNILFLNSFGIYFFLMLFDLIILDYLIVVKWHPKFLNLPDTDYYTKFKPHLKGMGRGMALGVIFSAVVSYLNTINL